MPQITLTEIPADMTFDEAVELLNSCTRNELRDHYFGDKEVHWVDGNNQVVAEGYHSGGGGGVSVCFSNSGYTFTESECRILMRCGKLGLVERNDSMGDDDFDIDE